MTKFHTDEYVKFLETVTPENQEAYAKQLMRCMIQNLLFSQNSGSNINLLVNVGEDCPVFDGMFQFCQISAGGSMGIVLSNALHSFDKTP